MELVAQSKKEKADVLEESREMLREAHALLAANAAGVRETLTGALDRQHFVGPCAKCGSALLIARSPRGSRWIQCVNNPASCTATYALPAAGFIEAAPEFLCATCKVPRLRITFRGQRPDLYCINPECPEHHKAFRIGTCTSCHNPLEIRYSFLGKRFVGCTGYPVCRVTYPLPQRGKLEKDQAPCPDCGAPVVTAIESGRPPWTLCINPVCPTRLKEAAERAEKKAAKEAAAKEKAAAKKPRASSKSRSKAPGTSKPRAPRKAPKSPDAVPGTVPAGTAPTLP
jgi:DNA topoisomerase-1